MISLRASDHIPQLSIDCVIFGFSQNQLKVLSPKLIFKGDFWSLPGGFVRQDESIDQAARRILEERTGIKDIYLEQFRVFGETDRSNLSFWDRLTELNGEAFVAEHFNRKELEWITKRFVSIGYYALVDITKVIPVKMEADASVEWYDIQNLPPMIMDHNQIVAAALVSLQQNLDQKLIAFNLLPETFTMNEVQQIYEVVLNKTLLRSNFQKKILDLNVLERLEKKFTGKANKAPYLYRWAQ
ncbi:NUDIX hydrolase [Dyadobacter luteus]|uniref:NUDIX hydrolase n=1 Tax=Dyadobacter luteus TaxID=2259619 RepID=A0A3D8YAU8_9BACT|nr:NUDIX domain-containing protein [Dyadobacter luteus]REA60904.1 NUDIX hydrolase [Dyadobacter luteus]